jgi:hypothetical protein
MRPHRAVSLLLAALALSACNVEENAVQDITGPDPGARVKFYNFGINAPGVNFYANTTKMTAVSSTSGTESNNGTAYGALGLAGLYSAIDPGQYTLTGKIAAATDKDLVIASVQTTIADGKHYSYYMSGFYNAAAKQSDAFVLEDVFPAEIDYSTAYVRFVNTMPNATGPLTLYAVNTGTTPPGAEVAVGAAVAYKAGGAFVPLPSGTYTLRARLTGVSTNVVERTNVGFAAGRVYTISLRGDATVSSTGTATNRPFLDNTANR